MIIRRGRGKYISCLFQAGIERKTVSVGGIGSG